MLRKETKILGGSSPSPSKEAVLSVPGFTLLQLLAKRRKVPIAGLALENPCPVSLVLVFFIFRNQMTH